jgi:hypothetical protein
MAQTGTGTGKKKYFGPTTYNDTAVVMLQSFETAAYGFQESEIIFFFTLLFLDVNSLVMFIEDKLYKGTRYVICSILLLLHLVQDILLTSPFSSSVSSPYHCFQIKGYEIGDTCSTHVVEKK